MEFLFLIALGVLFITLLLGLSFLLSLFLRNMSYIRLLTPLALIAVGWLFFSQTSGFELRRSLIMLMLIVWGMRISTWLVWEHVGSHEPLQYRLLRYRFRFKNFVFVFLTNHLLPMWATMIMLSLPLLGAQYHDTDTQLNIIDYTAAFVWLVGISIENIANWYIRNTMKTVAITRDFAKLSRWQYLEKCGTMIVWLSFGLVSLAGEAIMSSLGVLGAIAANMLNREHLLLQHQTNNEWDEESKETKETQQQKNLIQQYFSQKFDFIKLK